MELQNNNELTIKPLGIPGFSGSGKNAAMRSDGLKVFFDDSEDELSKILNLARAKEKDRAKFFQLFGIIRGFQIMSSYIRTHGNEEDLKFLQSEIDGIRELMQGANQKYGELE